MASIIAQNYTYLHLLIKRYRENEPGSQGLFLLHINQQIPWHEISVSEKKIYDVVYKECSFKFEKLSIFIAFQLPSMETGTNFLVFQSDLAAERTW